MLLQVLLLGAFGLCAAAGTSPAAPTPTALNFRPADPLNSVAFDHFYNLDYDHAVQEFTQVLQRHPDDPFAVNHLLTAVLFRELCRIGALNAGEYADDSFVGTAHRPADAKAKEQIKELVDRAFKLEAAVLDKNGNDVDALYARGVTRGLFSTYTALVERAWFSALRNAVGARRDHERVLELSPTYTDAKMIVGAHNYVLGSLPWAVKVAVSMVGLGGNKEKGLEYLKEESNTNGEASVDAKIVLVLFLRREHRYEESLYTVRGLIQRYPQNLLFAMEEGALLRAMEKYADSAAAYKKVWQAGKDGHYPGLHYESSAVALGDLLRSQKDFTGAAAAYEMVHQVQQLDPEISQKADLAGGEMYDVLQKRDLALKKYQAVVATDGGTPMAETARKRMNEPYRAP